MTSPKLINKICTETTHEFDKNLIRIGLKLNECGCGYFKINGKIYKSVETAVECMYNLFKGKYTIITDKQLLALIKKNFGITMTSTERNNLKNFNDKAKKIELKSNELSELTSNNEYY